MLISENVNVVTANLVLDGRLSEAEGSGCNAALVAITEEVKAHGLYYAAVHYADGLPLLGL